MSSSDGQAIAFATLIALVATGCSGGSSSPNGSPSAKATPTPAPATPPPSAPQPLSVFHLVGLAAGRTVIAPAGSNPTVPGSNATVVPVPNAIVTFPNGSIEVADANGQFTPPQSSYALAAANAPLIASEDEAQPQVSAIDPTGAAPGTSAVVPAYGAAFGSTLAGATPASTAPFLAGIRSLPDALSLYPTDLATLDVEATNVDDTVSTLAPGTVRWSAQSGQIATIAGTNEAIYVPPSTPGTDVVTAAIAAGGAPLYSATTHVTIDDPNNAFAISGTLSNAQGGAIALGTALFTKEDPPRIFPSFKFFAQANASGTYSRVIPPNADFNTAIGLTAPLGTLPGIFFPASPAGTTDTSITSGAAGTSATINLGLLQTTTEYDEVRDEATQAIPPPIQSVRDAWYGTVPLARAEPYDVDSGLQPLLALSPVPTTAAPQPVGSGEYARWCYEFSGTTLTVVDNTASTCSAPGNRAFVITPASGGYAFAEYALPAGAYSLAAPLSATQANAQLIVAGTWTQSPAPAATIPQSYTATVALGFFASLSQTPTVPSLSESYTQTSLLSGGLETTSIANNALVDPLTHAGLQTATATKTQTAALAGGSGCIATGTSCYTVSGSLVRTTATAGQTLTGHFSLAATQNGDGSAAATVTSTDAGSLTRVAISIANDAARTAGACTICPGAAGGFFDVDGVAQLGAFTSSNLGVVSLDLLNSTHDAPLGSPVDALTFAL